MTKLISENSYQEGPTDSWSSNGTHYNLNKIFKIAHSKKPQKLPTKNFESQAKRSKIHVENSLICGSCYNQVRNLSQAKINHNKRVQNTDLQIPIIVFKDNENWRVVDGAHRVEKAIVNDVSEITVIILDKKDLDQAQI